MKIKFKLLSDRARRPERSSDGAAGWDLFAAHEDAFWIDAEFPPTIETGLSVEIPPGHAMLILSRSGHGFKHGTRLANCVGLIDSDYRGEIKVKLVRDPYDCPSGLQINPGDRIAQAIIVPIPEVEWEEGDLSETVRGEGGFGSTGR